MENINLSGYELHRLLKVFGYSQPEFATYCNKSVSTIKRLFVKQQIARRFSEQFRELVGHESFDAELRFIRSQRKFRYKNMNYLLNELFDKNNDHLTLQEFRDKISK